jgi:hypothetical protein
MWQLHLLALRPVTERTSAVTTRFGLAYFTRLVFRIRDISREGHSPREQAHSLSGVLWNFVPEGAQQIQFRADNGIWER